MGRPLGADRPLVYGYLCMEEPDEAQITQWRQDLAVFCAGSAYRLGAVFVDRGVATSSLARTAFTALLAALKHPDAHAVVVPALTHLSTEDFVQEALARMVQLTNSRVLVAAPVPDTGQASR